MTQRELTSLCRWWQRRLGCTDWKVKVRFKSDEEMNHDGTPSDGLNFYSVEYRTSQIFILREEDRGEDSDPVEEDLVHELLHLVLNGHQPVREGGYDAMYERGINCIAKALVEGKYES